MDSHRFIPEFTIVTDDGTVKVPSMIKTYHALSKYILRKYLEEQSYKFNHKSRVQFMIDVIETQDYAYTLNTCVRPLSLAIVSNYDIYKKKGVLPLSTRDKKQVAYVIEKALLMSIDNFK